MRYRVRCGDCLAALGRRLLGLNGLERLVLRHRLEAACPCSGLVVAPERREMRVA